MRKKKKKNIFVRNRKMQNLSCLQNYYSYIIMYPGIRKISSNKTLDKSSTCVWGQQTIQFI